MDTNSCCRCTIAETLRSFVTLPSSIAQDAKKYKLKLFDPKCLVIGDMTHCTYDESKLSAGKNVARYLRTSYS